MGDPRQARENRAHVRRLLREKQPDFAAALELAVRDLSAQPGREPPGRAASASAATSAEALQRAQELRPEVVLVDIALGDESGFDLARRLAGYTGAAARR